MNKTNYFMRGRVAIDNHENIAILSSPYDTTVHMHDFVEIVYFYSSQGFHVVNNEKFYISNGNLCILNSMITHHYNIAQKEDSEIEVKNIIFFPKLFGDNFTAENFIDEMYFELMGKKPDKHYDFIHLSNDYNKEFFNLISIMQSELAKKELNYLDIIKSCMITIFLKIFRESTAFEKPSPIMLNNIRIIEAALHYINANYYKDLSLLEISKTYNLSNVYFNSLFKKYTGQTFRKYLQKLRIEKAKELLQNSDDTLDTICSKVGYSDLKQFHMLFKRIVGTTPFQYKKNIRFYMGAK